MGSCASRFKPNRKKNSNYKQKEEDQSSGGTVNVPVEDKLVITALQNPPVESSHASLATSPMSCDTAAHNSSSSSSYTSSLSSAFSMSTSKDKSSYSNDFVRPSLPLHHHKHRPVQLGAETRQPDSQAAGSTQKRQRASSPNLTRQKSLRRDPVGSTSIDASKASSLRSPSQSRRFISAQHEGNPMKIVSKSKGGRGYGKSSNTVVNKEKWKGLSDPNNQPRRLNRSPSMRKRMDTRGHSCVVSRINGISTGEGKGVIRQDVEMLPTENLDNPLIALDCFIFL